MKLNVISFTEKGIRLAEKLGEQWQRENRLAEPPALYAKCSAFEKKSPVIRVSGSVTAWAGERMESEGALVFIGACGIAVRAIAPWVKDKCRDNPVLVMDERGEYVIPILSGHLGGANELAEEIARVMGAVPVITTATDINRVFSVDLFAKKNGLEIVNREGIAKVSARALAGEILTASIQEKFLPDAGSLFSSELENQTGGEIRVVKYPPEQPVDLVISEEKKKFPCKILLRPKLYVVGMGCKRGKDAGAVADFIARSLREAGISEGEVLALATIDQKKEELGFLQWCQKKRVSFFTYSAEELAEVPGEFHGSEFVKEQVGVDNVCERAALKACGPGGVLVCEKKKAEGMTLAIARREWSVTWNAE